VPEQWTTLSPIQTLPDNIIIKINSTELDLSWGTKQ
jgi:hypothetical protein